MTLIEAINAHAQALTARNDIIAEISRLRMIDEPINNELIAQANALFLAEIEAERARAQAIMDAGRTDMYIAPTRPAEILNMEYKPIKRAGGKMVF